MRSAVNDADYSSDARDIQPALDVYARIGSEITAACESGQLQWFDRAATIQPPLYPQHKAAFPGAFCRLLIDTVGFRGVSASSIEFSSYADMGMLMTFDYVTGESAVRKSVYLEQMRPAFAEEMTLRKEGVMDSIGQVYQSMIPFLLVGALLVHLYGIFRHSPGERWRLFLCSD